jgi:hypothetical protein
MGAREQIRQRFNELSPALQQVARYVLDHPNEVVTGSMRNVGTRSQSTPATLVRFAQHLGFEGWPQLKEAFAADMGLGSAETYGGRAKQLVGRAKDQTLTGEMFEVQRRNLEATHQQSEQALQKACALIEKAPAVHAAGFRACFPIAFSFVYVYRLFRASVHLVDGQGGSLEMQQRQGGGLPHRRHYRQRDLAAVAAGGRDAALHDQQPLVLPVGRGRGGCDGSAGRTAGQPSGQAGDPAYRPGRGAALRIGGLPHAAGGARRLGLQEFVQSSARVRPAAC